MNTHKISITGTPPNLEVKVDGVPLPVTSADLHVDCESLPRLTVSCPGFGVDVETQALVELDEFTVRTITALGWLPPEHECI